MRATVIDDPVLTRFAAEVRDAYGDRLERIVLYGSRARGDCEPNSDYDIAVFIRDAGSLWDEIGLLGRISRKIAADTGADISAKPLIAGSHQRRTGFMHNLREDGFDL